MTFRQKITYFVLILIVYTLLNTAVYYFLREVLCAFSLSLLIKRLIFFFIILFINPFITYLIGEKVPFKVSGLKVADGLKAELHSDVEV